MDGVFNYKRELQNEGKDFTKVQLERAVKIEERERKKLQNFLKKTGT